MTRPFRTIALVVTGLCPGPVKRAIYRSVFGYRIERGVRLGFVFLDCKDLVIHRGARLRHGVVFTRCGAVTIGEEAVIGVCNVFRAGDRIDIGGYASILRLNVFNAIPDHECMGNPDSSLSIGRGAVVTAEHRLDFTDRISIGRSSILAGRATSLWTHNRRATGPITIGDHCYIGSETRMAPGASVPDCCIVGLGSVVIRSFSEPYSLLAGVPAVKRRALRASDHETIFATTRRNMPDDGYRPPPAPVETPSR